MQYEAEQGNIAIAVVGDAMISRRMQPFREPEFLQLYDALEADGRVAIRNILFDTNSATIQPESAPVLEQIATMMRQHLELKLMVEGHTDEEGDFDWNMELSADRAVSVKAYLVENFGIEADRMRTMGLGPTQPVDSNDTEEGRQQNRRVELVKI